MQCYGATTTCSTQDTLVLNKKTMKATMNWKGMHTTIQSIMKSWKACKVNKKQKLQYRHLWPNTIITIQWRLLCVDLIGPYTLKGKDGTVIDFLALTMINPTTSWFKIVELPLIRQLKTIAINGKGHLLLKKSLTKALIGLCNYSTKSGWVDTHNVVI